jgi:hypothetical protein
MHLFGTGTNARLEMAGGWNGELEWKENALYPKMILVTGWRLERRFSIQ